MPEKLMPEKRWLIWKIADGQWGIVADNGLQKHVAIYERFKSFDVTHFASWEDAIGACW